MKNVKYFLDSTNKVVIIVPFKHGTRYLKKLFPLNYNLPINEICSQPDWFDKSVYYLYRDPMENLVSALHTEVVCSYDSNTPISDIVFSFFNIDGDGDRLNGHWSSGILEKLYNLYIQCNVDIKLIDLKNLSTLLISLGYKIPIFDYEEFQFKGRSNWMNKEEIVEMMKLDYPIEWNKLMEIVKRETEFYNKLSMGVTKNPLKSSIVSNLHRNII